MDCVDALECLRRYDATGTLFYVDPPYHPDIRQRGGEYDKFDVDAEFHERLLEVIRDVRGMVALSGYHCELYDSVLSDFACFEKRVRVMAPQQDHQLAEGGERIECLWLNPHAMEIHPQQLSLFGYGGTRRQ